ncbi:MAG: NfeD family protein [Clostridia bacterium]|nr:NfeD family protein [Clostridia bacterium]
MKRSNHTDPKKRRSPMPPNTQDSTDLTAADREDIEPDAQVEFTPNGDGGAKTDAVNGKNGEDTRQNSPKADGRARAQKMLIALVCALGVLLLLNLIPFDRISAAISDTAKETVTVKTYEDKYFKTPDYDEDVTEDEIYQTKYDRLMDFKLGNETFTVTAETAESHGAVCVMFQRYMESLMAGDTAACDALFADAYIEKNGNFNFAPQKIYDMKVKVGESTFLKDGDTDGAYKGYTHYYCEVSYKILDNNGTLRRDFYEEGVTVPQMFEVVEKDGVAQITMISPIQIGEAPNDWKGITIMMYVIWIFVIAAAIFIEASTATLTAIWFMPGALVSLILALCGFSWQMQVVVFFLLSLVLTVIGTVFLRKRLLKKKPIPTNADRIIGMEGVVSENIDNLAAKGEVKADGKRWSARSEDGSTIEEGAIVTILRIEGVKLIVEKK